MRVGPLGIWELLIILVVVLLIFGPRRLPEMAKGLGQSVREFRKGIREMRGDFEDAAEESTQKTAKAPNAASGTSASNDHVPSASPTADGAAAPATEEAAAPAEDGTTR